MSAQYEDDINYKLGSRLAFSSYLGTVRYIGPVSGTSGLWLGVEWDDPARGKHNGSKDGVQYFHCSYVQPIFGRFH